VAQKAGQRVSSSGSNKDGALVTGKVLFFCPPFPFYLVAYKEQPVFEYPDSNCGAILGGPGDKRKGVYRGPQSTFSPFYRNGLMEYSIII
jgi:hypothetical protein